MYFTIENINNLKGIINGLNTIEDEQEKEQFLKDHIEDTTLFFEALRKLNKKKIPKECRKVQNQQEEDARIGLYKEEEIYEILSVKNNDEIMEQYSLSDLKNMYTSVYNRKPTSSYTKERIISTLRNRMHTMKRAEAFALLAEERQ